MKNTKKGSVVNVNPGKLPGAILHHPLLYVFFLLVAGFPAFSQGTTSLNIKDFGAKGDGVTNDRAAFVKALSVIQNQNGGKLYIPSGQYLVNAPIIIRSNTILEGDGKTSVIVNSAAGSPWGNCIHVGIGREFSDWNGSINKITDATFDQFDKGDYSNITTHNVVIRNLCTKSQNVKNGGLGIFVLNADNVTIDNIWGDGNATPINVGNDVPPYNGASRNVVVRNIHAINPGRWYDLVFIGMAENVDVSGCTFNSSNYSAMAEMITTAGRSCKIHDNIIKLAPNNNKKAILITSPKFGTQGNNQVYNNTLTNTSEGVVVFNADNNTIKNNVITGANTALHIYSRNNQIIQNNFQQIKYSVKLETDAARGSIIGNKGLSPANISDKQKLLSTYKSQ